MVKNPYNPPPVPPWLLKSARALRSNMTDAEQFLWYLLRRKQLGGFRFRRQHPLERFILDFYCPEAKLVVELDGGQHGDTVVQDSQRTAALQRRGIKVVRVWDNEVFENTEGVLEMIYSTLMERVEGERDGFPPP